MSYLLQWTNPALPGKADVNVNVASVNTTSSSLALTGKGAANYGQLQQQNLLKLLENSASDIPPAVPTLGELWYDSTSSSLKVCTSIAPVVWSNVGGIQVTDVGFPPLSANLGDLWFEKTGSYTGFLYIYTGTGRYPATPSTIGGWNQIWPNVEIAGARYEYDAMLELLLSLIGEPGTTGGNDAIRGLPLTDMQAYDTLLYNYHTTPPTPPVDINFAPSGTVLPELAMEPNSQDWDLLLAASKWALERIDIPANVSTAVSQFPFVQDGRLGSPLLTSLPLSDIRSLGGVNNPRNYQRRIGSISLARLYAETMNALSVSEASRYSLAGIAGLNSTIIGFKSYVVDYSHAVYTASYTGSTPTFLFLKINFANLDEYRRFVNGGSAIDMVLNYNVSTAGVNANWNNFINTNKTFRLIADRTLVLNSGNSLSVAPFSGGLLSTSNPAYTTLASVSSGGQTIIVSATRDAEAPTGQYGLTLRVQLTAPAGLTGTTTAQYRIIRDARVFGASTPFFPAPLSYVDGVDDDGSSVQWSTAAAPAAPVASFTVSPNPATGNPASITVTDTSTGSPTLIQWDFTNDGTFDASGVAGDVKIQPFTPGTYTIAMRASNANGSSFTTRTLTVN